MLTNTLLMMLLSHGWMSVQNVRHERWARAGEACEWTSVRMEGWGPLLWAPKFRAGSLHVGAIRSCSLAALSTCAAIHAGLRRQTHWPLPPQASTDPWAHRKQA